MPYTITVSTSHRIVEVVHEGHVSLNELELARAEASDRLACMPRRWLLVDVSRQTNRLSPFDAYRFNAGSVAALPVWLRLALVHAPGTERLVEQLIQPMRQSGINIRCFTSREQGIEWLVHEVAAIGAIAAHGPRTAS